MSRVQQLQHKGKQVVLVDLSGCTPDETIQIVGEAKTIIAKNPPKSCRVVTDVKGATYSRQVAEAIKDFVSHNSPYVKASAVVGAEGTAAVLLQTVIFLTRRELKSFGKREEALDWLASL